MKPGKTTFITCWILAVCLPIGIFAETQKLHIPEKAIEQLNNSPDSTNTIQVLVTSDPPGAAIFFDNTLVGQTPINVRTSIGTHTVVVWYYGYKRISKTIIVDSETQKIEFTHLLANPELPYPSDRQTRYLQNMSTENAVKPFFRESLIEDYQNQQAMNEYARKSEICILTGVTTWLIAIASFGIANDKYNQYKKSMDNRDELKKQVQTWDVISISSAAVCLLSTSLSIYYSKLSHDFIPSESIELSVIPLGNGAGVAISYKIHQK